MHFYYKMLSKRSSSFTLASDKLLMSFKYSEQLSKVEVQQEIIK